MSVQQSLWSQMSQVLFYYQHNSNSNMSLSVCDIKQHWVTSTSLGVKSPFLSHAQWCQRSAEKVERQHRFTFWSKFDQIFSKRPFFWQKATNPRGSWEAVLFSWSFCSPSVVVSVSAYKVENAKNKFGVERELAWRPEWGFSHVSPAACHFTFGNLYLTLSCTTGALGRCHSSAKHFKADRCPFTSGVGNGAWSSVGVQGPPTHSHDITDSTPTETAWSGC